MKTALITGGNSGIGWYTVLDLFLNQYTVYIAGRNKERVEEAISSISKEARNRAPNGEYGRLKFIYMDLSDLNSVKEAVATFQKSEQCLDLLINNAGIMGVPYEITKDGFEIQMQTNYLGHVLLDELLLPSLEQSVSPRIVYLASEGHRFCFMRFEPWKTFHRSPNILFSWFRYGMAKTFGIQYMKLLSLNHPEILCLSVHPGFIFDTGLFTHWRQQPLMGLLYSMIFALCGLIFGVSVEEGAKASSIAALSNEFTAQDNGAYLVTGGKKGTPSFLARDLDYASQSYRWALGELREKGFLDKEQVLIVDV